MAAFLEIGKASAAESGDSTGGTAFQHVDAFRAGFFSTFNDGLVAGLRNCVNGGASSEASSSSSSSG